MNNDGNHRTHTETFDRFYTRCAHLYDFAVNISPLWRRWIGQAVPHAHGPTILEISFGPGLLFERYAPGSRIFGLEYNWKMLGLAKRKTGRANLPIALQRGDVYALPYKGGIFDTVVNTMAFSGYRDAGRAIAEMNRVLKPGGKLVMVDINLPGDENPWGTRLTRLWAAFGDIIRDMDAIFTEGGFQYVDKEIGGWGCVHLYVATKQKRLHDGGSKEKG